MNATTCTYDTYIVIIVLQHEPRQETRNVEQVDLPEAEAWDAVLGMLANGHSAENRCEFCGRPRPENRQDTDWSMGTDACQCEMI